MRSLRISGRKVNHKKERLGLALEAVRAGRKEALRGINLPAFSSACSGWWPSLLQFIITQRPYTAPRDDQLVGDGPLSEPARKSMSGGTPARRSSSRRGEPNVDAFGSEGRDIHPWRLTVDVTSCGNISAIRSSPTANPRQDCRSPELFHQIRHIVHPAPTAFWAPRWEQVTSNAVRQ